MKIGITGGIGSGKSTVCRIFRELGVPVYDSDLEAKKLTATHPEIRKQLIAKFGTEVYFDDHSLNKKYLAEIIFTKKEDLTFVNGVIHPIVNQNFNDWVERHRAYPYLLKEAAILFESGAYKQMDEVIMVFSPIDLRIKRVVQRDGVEKKTVLERIENQMSEEEKMKKSDEIVYNDDKNMLIPQILRLHKKYLSQN